MTKTQSKTGYTPGPWRLAESALEQWVAGTTPEGAPDAVVCDRPHFEMDNPEHQARWEANARLIAQAPAMAEALRDCLGSLRRLPDAEGAYRVTCIQQAERVLRDAGVEV